MHTAAMEISADMVREILMEDEDGIIPLVPNAGEKVLLDRIEEKFREKGFSSAQYSMFRFGAWSPDPRVSEQIFLLRNSPPSKPVHVPTQDAVYLASLQRRNKALTATSSFTNGAATS
jgi:hypothetical protein